jgi:hypothetical protein
MMGIKDLEGRSTVHVRNGRAQGHPQTFGDGVTWCGKKLIGKPEREEAGLQVFSCYGSEVHVSDDPSQTSCARCRAAFDAAYSAAFPEGLKPLATFKLDSAADMARAKDVLAPETLTRFFGAQGEGMTAYEQFLRDPLPLRNPSNTGSSS